MTPSSLDRIATRNLQEYNSVQVNEDEEELEDHDEPFVDDDDHLPQPTRRRRYRRLPTGASCSTGCCITFYILSMLLTLLGALLAVVVYRDVVVSHLAPYASPSPPSGSPSATTMTMTHSDQASPSSSSSSSYVKRSYPIYYDPSVGQQPKQWNPYNDPPQPPPQVSTTLQQQSTRRGYLQQPSLYNNTLVFLSEGDLYLTTLSSSPQQSSNGSTMSAMRLTTTIGNVQTPKLYQNAVAFTATYTGRRDVYLMNLQAGTTERLTYTSSSGIRGIAQLDSTSVWLTAPSPRVSLPDIRLFRRFHDNATMTEVPLSQAVDGVSHESCLYFVRFKQSSHTVRYVGGTAESLWVYCDGQALAMPLTASYNGTSKAPAIGVFAGEPYLIFLSDRSALDDTSDEWRATSMNLWAMPLPTVDIVYSGGNETSKLPRPIQITHVSCQFDGMALQEYSVDPVTNNVVLRIGADLHSLTSKQVERRIQTKVATVTPQLLPIHIYSDFHDQQERLILANPIEHMLFADVFQTAHGTTNLLATLRGQTWVLPVQAKATDNEYQGSGQNMPARRYRVVPGAMTGGMMRVLTSRNVPLLLEETPRRLSVVLATDPLSPTAEHAFYLVETQSDISSAFADLTNLPEPFLGGRKIGGSTRDGGLGSVRDDSVTISPCGRRMAWADTDGRILVMTLPVYSPNATYTKLNDENEMGEPMDGTMARLLWSPGGRYLAVEHQARNQFSVITIVDCGDPGNDVQVDDIALGRHVQATPNRFNSYRMLWGKSPLDYYLNEKLALLSLFSASAKPETEDVATTLYFLTDRDIVSDVFSPWGSRAPAPHFATMRSVWALALSPEAVDSATEIPAYNLGRFSGGGAQELFADALTFNFEELLEEKIEEIIEGDDETLRKKGRQLLKDTVEVKRRVRSRKLQHEALSWRRFLRHATRQTLSNSSEVINGTLLNTGNSTSPAVLDDNQTISSPSLDLLSKPKFPRDMNISFGGYASLELARNAYRMTQIPKAKYVSIISQTRDDGTLVLADVDGGVNLQLFSPMVFPSDDMEQTPISAPFDNFGVSTCRNYVWIVFAPTGKTKVIENTISGWAGLLGDVGELASNMVDTSQLALSVFPSLEYRQMFNDAWRMLRDFFYDPKMHGTDWPAIHARYSELVERCTKREELDDVLAQLSAELSALHVFVYGGEYNSPIDENDDDSLVMVTPGNLGANLIREPAWKGYRIVEIPLQDPDFNLMNDEAVFSPLSDQTLKLTGQKGLKTGDVIVAINGESVMQVPDIHMLLRGTIGRSVRLEVLRLASNKATNSSSSVTESVITSPISPSNAANLFYNAWEWKTRQAAKRLAAKANFTVAYVHMRSMLRDDENAFARGFFPDYDAQALILDVRHNNGGNIDSWILTMLQRQAWMYWQSRTGMRQGDADWDNQFAFRGHIVVLIDEMTASDGEGVSRGMSELGLGRLIGTRTWGGGIWLSSDNILVDGGIASAPEIGTFNEKFGWGLGIEQHGVVPDIEVDNNPRTAFDAVDTQLEAAIRELKKWLKQEPVVIPNPPKTSVDMSLHGENCPV